MEAGVVLVEGGLRYNGRRGFPFSLLWNPAGWCATPPANSSPPLKFLDTTGSIGSTSSAFWALVMVLHCSLHGASKVSPSGGKEHSSRGQNSLNATVPHAHPSQTQSGASSPNRIPVLHPLEFAVGFASGATLANTKRTAQTMSRAGPRESWD